MGDPPPRRAPAAAPVRAARHRSAASLAASCSCRATASTPRTAAASRRILADAPPARRASTTRRACPSPCSCACTTWSTSSRACVPDFDAREIETLLVAATRSWADDLEEALLEETARSDGGELFQRYGDAFPAAYRADWVAALGARRHRARSRSCPRPTTSRISLYRPLEAPAADAAREAVPRRAGRWRCPTCCRCSRTWASRSPTSAPTRSPRAAATASGSTTSASPTPAAGTSTPTGSARASRTRSCAPGAARSRTTATTGSCCGAALTWREITVLRAIGKYLRQARDHLQRPYVEQALVAHPEVARLLVALFQARFDPTPRRDRADAERARRADRRGDRRGREPRPGPHPAQLPRGDPGDAAHELLPDGAPTAAASPTCRSSSTRRQLALAAPAAPAVRDLRLLAAHRGRAPARRQGGARRASAGRTGARTSAPRCSA